MSHAGNKVDWCLKKAEKELEEGKKHRGLIKKNFSIEDIRNHLEKAEHDLAAIAYFDKGGYSDWSMSAIFYSIYHCFLVIAAKFGFESRNQECTIALIKMLRETGKINLEERFVKALESYNDQERHESNIIEKRELYTYGTTMSVEDKEEIKRGIELCKDCLDQTKRIVLE